MPRMVGGGCPPRARCGGSSRGGGHTVCRSQRLTTGRRAPQMLSLPVSLVVTAESSMVLVIQSQRCSVGFLEGRWCVLNGGVELVGTLLHKMLDANHEKESRKQPERHYCLYASLFVGVGRPCNLEGCGR